MDVFLFLFDIDGTLIRTGNASRRAFQQAVRNALGKEVDFMRRDLGGRTDLEIFYEVLTELYPNISEEDREYKTRLIFRELPSLLRGELEKESRDKLYVCPGVIQFLEVIRKYKLPVQIVNGILTGNIRATAEVKLQYFGLDKYFDLRFGAFGDDSFSRTDLVDIAAARSIHYALVNRIVPPRCPVFDSVILFGDSPRDIYCAREARIVSVVFPTGRYSREELERNNPDFVFDSFGELCQPENLEELLENAKK